MSNLLTTENGRTALIYAQRHLLKERMSRFFQRNIVIDIAQTDPPSTAGFDLATMLGDLNEQHDPEIEHILRLLGTIGGLQESLGSVQTYVDPENGSDETGDGSEESPWASLWFLDFLPSVIRHTYIIRILSDLTEPFHLCLNCSFKDKTQAGTGSSRGSLNFVGVGQEKEVLSGLAGQVDSTNVFMNTWRENTLSVAPTADCARAWIYMDTGPDSRNVAAVNRVDVANKRIWTRWRPVYFTSATDQYRYVVPGRSMNIYGGTLSCFGSQAMRGEAGPEDMEGSRVNFVNLTVKIDPGGDSNLPVRFITEGVPMGFWFCQIETEDGTDPVVEFRNKINRYHPIGFGLRNILKIVSETQIDNLWHDSNPYYGACGLQFIKKDSGEFTHVAKVLKVTGSGAEIWAVDCMALITAALGNMSFDQVSCKEFFASHANVFAVRLAMDPNVTFPAVTALTVSNSEMFLSGGLFGTCVDAIRLNSARLRTELVGGDTGGTMTNITDYAGRISGCSFWFMENDWQGTSGTLNDLIFPDPSPDQTFAFPAAANARTDFLINTVTRLT